MGLYAVNLKPNFKFLEEINIKTFTIIVIPAFNFLQYILCNLVWINNILKDCASLRVKWGKIVGNILVPCILSVAYNIYFFQGRNSF